jgi:hypothetical protein
MLYKPDCRKNTVQYISQEHIFKKGKEDTNIIQGFYICYEVLEVVPSLQQGKPHPSGKAKA